MSLRELQVSRAGDVTLNTRGENGREFRGVSVGRIWSQFATQPTRLFVPFLHEMVCFALCRPPLLDL